MNVTKAEYLPIDKLHPFENHPFQVKDDDEMEQLVWSILSQGIMTPIIVRPTGEGEQEAYILPEPFVLLRLSVELDVLEILHVEFCRTPE